MKKTLYLLIPFLTISCTSPNNNEKKSDPIIDNKELEVSVFKKEFKNNMGSYYIWTKYKKSNKQQVDSIRKVLGLSHDYTIYLYSDSTMEEGHYYACCLNVFRTNPHHNEKIRTFVTSSKENMDYTIRDLNEGIQINSIGSILLFQDQVRKGKKMLYECDDKSMRDKLRRALSSFQKKHFPLARKIYYNNAKEKLWEKNIEVKLIGRDITFEGYMFADNATIKATYEEVRQELEDLRFKTVGFRWYEGGDRTYWKLSNKNDEDI